MNTPISSSAQLTAKDFHKLQRDATRLYCDAVWNMADLLTIAKSKFGRKNLLEMTNLPTNKVDWFIAIGSMPYRNGALPETHYECADSKNPKKWLKLATKEKLKPTEVRKRIRESHREIKQQKPLDVAQWPKSLLLMERELQSLEGDKTIVVQRLQPLVALYASISASLSSSH